MCGRNKRGRESVGRWGDWVKGGEERIGGASGYNDCADLEQRKANGGEARVGGMGRRGGLGVGRAEVGGEKRGVRGGVGGVVKSLFI